MITNRQKTKLNSDSKRQLPFLFMTYLQQLASILVVLTLQAVRFISCTQHKTYNLLVFQNLFLNSNASLINQSSPQVYLIN